MSKRMTRAELERKLVELQEHHSHTWAKYNETIQGLGGKIQELNKAREQVATLERDQKRRDIDVHRCYENLVSAYFQGRTTLEIVSGHNWSDPAAVTSDPMERLVRHLVGQLEALRDTVQGI